MRRFSAHASGVGHDVDCALVKSGSTGASVDFQSKPTLEIFNDNVSLLNGIVGIATFVNS